ncbi:ABC transporter substrate-binding protein [Pectobacterium betavasculorum]|uniref:ABC transporter substrate-binding protein n=1 Tax=Pectobacterium betavasculorum TaxID=55207 RepID=A0A093U2Z3_9GAMM|nr:ABC transporter substrate-binding protein [Pectobacterium betavasculorum]KFX02628.1 ABC transporter substrate-binding protein [Pectobacterium betavasculorum]
MLKKTFMSLLVAITLPASFSTYATEYPVTITDIDGRNVKINQEPKRIVVQDGRDIMTLALLDRDNPFKRLVAWNNIPKKSDTATWNVLKTQWPEADKILDMGFGDKGEVELESVLSKQPDLMVAQLRAKPSLTESGVLAKLSALNIPVVFIDSEVNPAKNTASSIDLLGTVLNQEDNAKAYSEFYRQHLTAIQQKTATLPKKANVFVEAWAGRSDSCCFSHAHNGWGGMVEAIGANNIGSALLPGANGDVSLEKLISMKPDVYIMTGAKRNSPSSKTLPLGYNANKADIAASAEKLISRQGVSQIPAVVQKHVVGIYHPFYNHPYNIVGMEYLAKAIYPQLFTSLNPDDTYRHIIQNFTSLPDSEFIFAWKQGE